MLPPIDQAHLDERAPECAVTHDGGMICVVIPNFGLPEGFTQPSADLLLRLSPGYPDVPPDMWWFNPPVQRTDGCPIVATECQETHLGRVGDVLAREFPDLAGMVILRDAKREEAEAIVRPPPLKM